MGKMHGLVAGAAAAMLVAGAAWAQDSRAGRPWQSVGKWGAAEVFIDRSDVKASGTAKLFWSKAVFGQPLDTMPKVRTMYTQFRLVCAEQTMQIIEMHGVDADGSATLDAAPEEIHDEATQIRPGSPNDAIQKLLCV
jgi:hypothetical protein